MDYNPLNKINIHESINNWTNKWEKGYLFLLEFQLINVEGMTEAKKPSSRKHQTKLVQTTITLMDAKISTRRKKSNFEVRFLL